MGAIVPTIKEIEDSLKSGFTNQEKDTLIGSLSAFNHQLSRNVVEINRKLNEALSEITMLRSILDEIHREADRPDGGPDGDDIEDVWPSLQRISELSKPNTTNQTPSAPTSNMRNESE